MNRKLLFILLCLVLLPCFSWATVIDSPHNESHDMSCGNCHTYSLWWQFSPSDQNPDRNSFIIEPLCDSCHNELGSAPFALTHSASAMGGMHQQGYGDWGRSCLDCHDPHFQQQFRGWLGDSSVADTDIYLAQGSIDIDTLVDNGNNTSYFSYSLISGKTRVAWTDPSQWSDKTGPGRGVMLVVSLASTENTFEVFSATETTPEKGTMTVNGVIPASFNGADFGLIYGQLIKKQIDGAAGLVDVKFFDGRGGFVSNNMDGICQVCHTQTNHFQYDSAIDGHIDVLGAANAATLRCTTCHAHDVAFGHGTDGGSDCQGCHNSGKHVSHLSLELTCSRCHDLANMRDGQGAVVLRDGLHIATTTVCANCHHNGTDLIASDGNNPPNQTDFKDGWSNGTYTFSCQGCHDTPPNYQNGSPKTNSHAVHSVNGYGCENCHYDTTQDGINLKLDGAHVNSGYDIVAGPGVTLGYTYYVNGGTCSNISCHNGGTAVWGASLACLDCHQNSVDVNGVDSLETARINITEWQTTGHGRDWGSMTTSTYSGSGKPGAALICDYCHDSAVGHNTTINPYRLANIGGADGMNGVCWTCHKSGSPGYDPDGAGSTFALKNANNTKVDSYHSGSRHGTGANNGGKFCWDCHDPHGDANIYMVHSEVSLLADQTYGVPSLTAPVSFTANNQGTDYAQSVGPFTGICNVCHANTSHYTSTSGDGHQAGQVCTNCHEHSTVKDNEAFFQGSCLDCHDTSQGVRRPIIGEFPALDEPVLGEAHAHFGGVLDSGDCTVCHDQTTHMDGKLDLFGADGTVLYRGDNAMDLISNQHPDHDISDFCESCHDSDGASRLVAPYDPMDPFGNGNQPPDVATRFKGSLKVLESVSDFCWGNGISTKRPVSSHHDISKSDQDFSGAKIECTSCHAVHTSSATAKIVDPNNKTNIWGDNLVQEPFETMNNFCLTCHAGGTGPNNPGFPTGVTGPVYSRINIPGSSCGANMVWDCADQCRDATEVAALMVDNFCDDGDPVVDSYDLRCYAAFQYIDSSDNVTLLNGNFNNDDGDCGPIALENNYSLLSGIDTCQGYSQNPWNNDISWSHSPHGASSKRGWSGYVQIPQVPEYELDCVACHDPHGSYSLSNPGGNPYMIRDFVDGTGFVDDGSREGTQWGYNATNPSVNHYGVSGTVSVTGLGDSQGWASFCGKCHGDWSAANVDSHRNGCACLTCHSHGGAMGDMDHYGVDDTTWCPGP